MAEPFLKSVANGDPHLSLVRGDEQHNAVVVASPSDTPAVCEISREVSNITAIQTSHRHNDHLVLCCSFEVFQVACYLEPLPGGEHVRVIRNSPRQTNCGNRRPRTYSAGRSRTYLLRSRVLRKRQEKGAKRQGSLHHGSLPIHGNVGNGWNADVSQPLWQFVAHKAHR